MVETSCLACYIELDRAILYSFSIILILPWLRKMVSYKNTLLDDTLPAPSVCVLFFLWHSEVRTPETYFLSTEEEIWGHICFQFVYNAAINLSWHDQSHFRLIKFLIGIVKTLFLLFETGLFSLYVCQYVPQKTLHKKITLCSKGLSYRLVVKVDCMI